MSGSVKKYFGKLSLYNGHFLGGLGGIRRENFWGRGHWRFFASHFTTDISSSKRRYRNENLQKICTPAFAKAGARCICGYEIWESSKHIRCPYTPEKWAVQPCARTAHFVVGESPHPFHVWIENTSWTFQKALAFIRFDDYNYTVIL